MKYKYKFVRRQYADDMERLLNELGHIGWEVINIRIPDRPDEDHRAWLKYNDYNITMEDTSF